MTQDSDPFTSDHMADPVTPAAETLGDTARQAADKAADLAASARDTARKAADTTRAEFSTAYARARDTAARTGGTMADAALQMVDRRLGETAEGLRTLSDALHRAADESADPAADAPAGTIPRRLVELAAGSCDAMADMIADRNTRDVADDLAAFGRGNPATFAMGALLAGFAIGRLLTGDDPAPRRASAPDRVEP